VLHPKLIALVLCLAAMRGASWNTPADITALADYEVGARVDRDSAGNVHLIWYGGVDSASWQINYQSWNGASWSAPVTISGSAAGTCDVAVDANGDVHAVWNAGGNPEEVYYRKRTAGVWGATVNLSNSGERSLTPHLAVDPAGTNILVAWHESAQTGGDWDILIRRFANGVWQPVENISQDSTLSRNADVAIDAGGAFHLVWEDLGTKNLFYRKRNIDGTYSAKTPLDTTAGRSYGGSIAVSANGHIHVAWHDDNSDWEIFYRRFNGSVWETPINVSQRVDPDHADHSANVTTDANNDAHIVWSDYQNIYYAHSLGGVMRPGYRVNPGANEGDPVCVIGAGNVLHAVWPNRDPGSWDLFHARHTLPDTIAPNTVQNFSATPANQQVRLQWSIPSAIDYSGLMIRWKTNGFPSSPADGSLATNAGPDEFTFTHHGLVNGVTYYYSAFAYDAEPNYAAAATAQTIPIAAPKTNWLRNAAMEGGFVSGVAGSWQSYRFNDPNTALAFVGDTANFDSSANSQAITNLGAANLPASGFSAAGLFQVVSNTRAGAVYLFVGYQDIYTSDFGADGARYQHNFGINPSGSTNAGSSFDLGKVGGASWMGARTLYNNNSGGAPFFGGFHRARAAFVALSNRVSVWTGVAINNAGTRDNVPAKFNADTHYLFEFDFPTNASLVNGDIEGPSTDLQDGSDVLPDGWAPTGGGVGQVNSWQVATNFARTQNATNRGVRVWSRRGIVNAGLMQRIAVTPGQAVTFSAWTRTSGQDNTEASIGIDPFGGGDIDSFDIVWFSTPSATWTQLVASVAAQGPVVTVFMRTSSTTGGGNYQWSDFDDAAFTGGGAAFTSIVPAGSVWKYLPITNDIGAAWRGTNYDDGAWPTGPAQLGYGDNDEATPVPFYDDGVNGKNISTYFRRNFAVTNAARFTNLVVRLLRDDGGIVYLNGTEVFRSNMTNSPVTWNTPALTSVAPPDETTTFYSTNAPASLLREGLNVLGVEIHQVSGTSADISFDLQLLGIADPTYAPNQLPVVALSAPATNTIVAPGTHITLTADAQDSDGEIQRLEFFVGATKIGEASIAPFSMTWSNVPAGVHSLTARATDDDGGQATSGVVVIRAENPRVAISTSPLAIAWPAWATNFRVFSASNLVSPIAWQLVTNPPTLSNDSFVLPLGETGREQEFFRLQAQ
jgi:hypothetical protein